MYLCKFMPALATVLIKLAHKLGADKTDPSVQDTHRHFFAVCIHSFDQLVQDINFLKT